MLSYTKVQSKPRVLQSLTGLNVAEFEQLLVSFEGAGGCELHQQASTLLVDGVSIQLVSPASGD